MKDLNDRLTKQSYMAGYVPSDEDQKFFKQIFGENKHVIQWAARMATYYPNERAAMAPMSVEEERPASDEDSN